MSRWNWHLHLILSALLTRRVNPNDDFCYLKPECDDTHWKDVCTAASSKQQSPIDLLSTNETILEKSGLKFNAEYRRTQKSFYIVDTGHSLQIQLEKDLTSKLEISGIEGSAYRLAQVHFHWGLSNEIGSEHTINGKHYSAEVHFVHFRTVYNSFGEALAAAKAGKRDAFAVLGVLLEINTKSKSTPSFKPIFDGLRSLGKSCGKLIEVKAPINLLNFMGIRKAGLIYRYDGSLTTPPCSEAVIWSVFANPKFITVSDIEALRALKTCHGDPLGNNFRRVQLNTGSAVDVRHLKYELGTASDNIQKA